jgi:hypothetical protein
MTRSRVLYTLTLLLLMTLVGMAAADAQHQAGSCDAHPRSKLCKSQSPSPSPTSSTPTTAPTTAPTTTAPTRAPTSSAPTSAPTSTTTAPTSAPTSSAPTSAPTSTAPPATSCQDANAVYIWNTWNSGGLGAYYADADWWAANGYNFAQKTVICSYHSWYVQATADNSTGDGAVKAYPNVHRDYHNWSTGAEPAISSFKTITSRFAHQSPGVGIYNVAYDVWLNGVADSGSTEVMIWTDNHLQVPAGSKVAQVSLSGQTWDVWASGSNHYLAFVPANKATLSSGTLDLLAFFKYLMSSGRLPSTSTLGQVDYGVEIVSTDAEPARWDFTDFDVSTS